MTVDKYNTETWISFARTYSESNIRTGDEAMAKAGHFNAWSSIAWMTAFLAD